jgi:hypothetical protein
MHGTRKPPPVLGERDKDGLYYSERASEAVNPHELLVKAGKRAVRAYPEAFWAIELDALARGILDQVGFTTVEKPPAGQPHRRRIKKSKRLAKVQKRQVTREVRIPTNPPTKVFVTYFEPLPPPDWIKEAAKKSKMGKATIDQPHKANIRWRDPRDTHHLSASLLHADLAKVSAGKQKRKLGPGSMDHHDDDADRGAIASESSKWTDLQPIEDDTETVTPLECDTATVPFGKSRLPQAKRHPTANVSALSGSGRQPGTGGISRHNRNWCEVEVGPALASHGNKQGSAGRNGSRTAVD